MGSGERRSEKMNEVGFLGERVEEVISSDGSGGAGVEDTSSDSRKKKPDEKVRVRGARRVWGTLKLTTPSSLKSAISKFCPANSIQIKRKTVCDNDGRVKRWWFVVHAPEDILVKLDAAWEQLKLQTGWKLEPCFKPSSHTIPESSPSPSSPCPISQPTSGSTEESHNLSISHVQNFRDSDSQAPSHTPFGSTPFLEN